MAPSTRTRGALPRHLLIASLVSGSLVAACDEGAFAVEVVAFEPGPGAGFGQDGMPGIVLGPPAGGSASKGSTNVVSLGQGGSIVLRLGRPLVDGEGPDLIVFENPFETPTGLLFAEPGVVAVGSDGEAFTAFPCAPAQPAPNGCAGYGPVFAGDNDVSATDPASAGGDAFDLADLGIDEARYVKIVDAGDSAAPPTAGFDLDAVAVVERPAP